MCRLFTAFLPSPSHFAPGNARFPPRFLAPALEGLKHSLQYGGAGGILNGHRYQRGGGEERGRLWGSQD